MRRPAQRLGDTLAIGVVVVIVLGLLGCAGGKEAVTEESPEPLSEEPTDGLSEVAPEETVEEGAAPQPLRKRNVRLFFPSASGEGLVGESHTIFDTAPPGDRIKQIVADLIEGPQRKGALRAMSQDVILRQVYVLDNGVAFLDFSDRLTGQLAGGSMDELLTVYAIVDSVALNVPEIGRVGILINGRTVETLNGHMDLRRPLPPDRSLILRSSAA